MVERHHQKLPIEKVISKRTKAWKNKAKALKLYPQLIMKDVLAPTKLGAYDKEDVVRTPVTTIVPSETSNQLYEE